MNVILDECLPRRLIRDLSAYTVTTVPREGLAGITNGKLLDSISGNFDALVTRDKSIEHQQDLGGLQVCLIVLHVLNSRYETIEPLLPQIRDALKRITPGRVIHIQS